MFQGPGASRAARRLPRGAGSILNGAYPSELFPPCQLCRVTAVCALSLLVAVGPYLPRASPRASDPVWTVPSTSGLWADKKSVARVLALPPGVRSVLPWVLILSGTLRAGPLRRVPKNLGVADAQAVPEGSTDGRRRGFAPLGANGTPKSAAARAGRRWGSEELRGCSDQRRCLQLPTSPIGRSSEEGWFVGPAVRFPASPKRSGSSGLGEGSSASLPRKGWGAQASAAGTVAVPKSDGGASSHLSASPPKGIRPK